MKRLLAFLVLVLGLATVAAPAQARHVCDNAPSAVAMNTDATQVSCGHHAVVARWENRLNPVTGEIAPPCRVGERVPEVSSVRLTDCPRE